MPLFHLMISFLCNFLTLFVWLCCIIPQLCVIQWHLHFIFQVSRILRQGFELTCLSGSLKKWFSYLHLSKSWLMQTTNGLMSKCSQCCSKPSRKTLGLPSLGGDESTVDPLISNSYKQAHCSHIPLRTLCYNPLRLVVVIPSGALLLVRESAPQRSLDMIQNLSILMIWRLLYSSYFSNWNHTFIFYWLFENFQ